MSTRLELKRTVIVSSIKADVTAKEEVHKSYTEGKISVSLCKIDPFQVKIIHSF